MKKTLLLLAILSGLFGRFLSERQALLLCDISQRIWGHEAGHKALIYWNLRITQNYGCAPRLCLRLAQDQQDPTVSVALLTVQRHACRENAFASELAEVEAMLANYEFLVDPPLRLPGDDTF